MQGQVHLRLISQFVFLTVKIPQIRILIFTQRKHLKTPLGGTTFDCAVILAIWEPRIVIKVVLWYHEYHDSV